MLIEDEAAPATVDARAPAEARLRGRHHHPQGLPARGTAPLPQPRLPAHRLRARRDPPGRLVGHRSRPVGRQGREPPRRRLRHDPALLGARTASSSRTRRPPPTPCPRLSGCLARLGGVPERLVTDRDSSLVARPARRRARPVDELAALLGAALHGSHRAAGDPESKGSVERTNGYLETSFLPLRRFSASPTCRASTTPGRRRSPGRATCAASAAGWWRRSPWSAPSWPPCPSPPPETDRRLEVRASRDGFARVAGVDYSLPPGLRRPAPAGAALAARSRHLLRGPPIARHARSYVPCDVVRDGAHTAALAAAQEAQRRLARR